MLLPLVPCGWSPVQRRGRRWSAFWAFWDVAFRRTLTDRDVPHALARTLRRRWYTSGTFGDVALGAALAVPVVPLALAGAGGSTGWHAGGTLGDIALGRALAVPVVPLARTGTCGSTRWHAGGTLWDVALGRALAIPVVPLARTGTCGWRRYTSRTLGDVTLGGTLAVSDAPRARAGTYLLGDGWPGCLSAWPIALTVFRPGVLQTRLSRGSVAPFLDDGLLHLPRIPPRPDAHLLGDVDAIFVRLQVWHELGHMLA